MIKVAIIDQDGKPMLPSELSTAAELHVAAEQAKVLIRDCERIARLKAPPGEQRTSTPYLT